MGPIYANKYANQGLKIKIELTTSLLGAIHAQISSFSLENQPLETVSCVSRGQINQSLVVSQGQRRYFIKLNLSRYADMFAAEVDALKAIQKQNLLHVPEPVGHGSKENAAFLILEHLNLTPHGNAQKLGEGLACLHEIVGTSFGWHRDNTIGTTPQPNPQYQGWPEFWAEQRIRFQLELAAGNGHTRLRDKATPLLENASALFTGYEPQPSLLHGDLWCGNSAYLENGNPVIFDPASYFGDRETDLAMTELFGGFQPAFYAAYSTHLPLDPGYGVRKTYYQLYHVLNHLNLFGTGYLAQANHMIETLLSEIR